MPSPLVSAIIANYNGGLYLEAAVRSAMRQTMSSLEILVADDGSSDRSAAIVARLAAEDDRVKWLPAERNGGPAEARNRGIAAARGDWLAILDSDDLWHPRRLAALVDFAIAQRADIVADDMLLFDNERSGVRRFLAKPESSAPFEVTAERYLTHTIMYGAKPNLGYLKPLFRRSALHAHAIAYDPRLRIGEDDDLITQALSAGLCYWVQPSLTYFYRQHTASISFRFEARDRSAMRAAAARVAERFAGASPDSALAAALRRREQSIDAADIYHSFLDSLRSGRLWPAIYPLLMSPRAMLLLRQPFIARTNRVATWLVERHRGPPPGRPNVLFVSRQRITGRNNGSSTYLLDLAHAFRQAGIVPHLLQPSPTITGRRPILTMTSDMDVFETHQVRGVLRLGRRIVSLSPRVWWAALSGIAKRAARRFGLARLRADPPFPHTIAIAWNDADRIFTASRGHRYADIIIVDYIFQTEAIPTLVRPDAPSAVLMHDLYALRSESFAGTAGDSIEGLDRAREISLLQAADAVIAIQATEAAWTNAHVPGVEVLLAPMAAYPVANPQPGDDHGLLFVGSNTPPNVIALQWFFAEIWPLVRAARSDVALRIAGAVSDSFSEAPEGIEFLGLVSDLAPLYAACGVVISPLTVGSGLKIKLIEALAHGKAIVATPTTIQGVEEQVTAAVVVRSEPHAFAQAILSLLADRDHRTHMARAALSVARACFSPDACYGGVTRWAQHRLSHAGTEDLSERPDDVAQAS